MTRYAPRCYYAMLPIFTYGRCAFVDDHCVEYVLRADYAMSCYCHAIATRHCYVITASTTRGRLLLHDDADESLLMFADTRLWSATFTMSIADAERVMTPCRVLNCYMLRERKSAAILLLLRAMMASALAVVTR